MLNHTESSITPYKVCILAYDFTMTLAQDVIEKLPDNDVKYLIFNAGLDEKQDICVAEARQQGCEVFVAGPASAARFMNYYTYPLIPYEVRPIDYIIAINQAVKLGGTHLGLVRYRYSPAPDLPLLRELTNISLTELIYDEIPQVYPLVKRASCDIFIGNYLTQHAAKAADKQAILLYAGKEAIRDACIRAGELAHTLYDTERGKAIAESVLNTAQLGIIVANAQGNIEFFNRTMQQYTGMGLHEVSNRALTEVFPNLPLHRFVKSGLLQNDSYHLINDTMMRCIFQKIMVGTHTGGTLLTIHPNPHNLKKERSRPKFVVKPIYKLEKITMNSPIMKRVVTECYHLSPIEHPTVIIGPSGSGREEIAHCLHNASRRASKPCIILDCATLDEDHVATMLYGYGIDKRSVDGLLLNANEGSMIIKNISIAGPKLQAALLSIIQQQQFFHPGMIAPITFDIVFYTIVTDEEYHHLRSDLRCCFDILHITLPPLCTRKEDICELFQSYVMQLSPDKRAHQLTPLMKEILTQYSWPGNVRELRAVSTRYVLLLKKAARHTVQHRYESLLNAIGQDTLRHDIYTQYHALLERPIKDMASFYAGLKLLHLFFSQTYEELAQELGLSRTTLWRIKKEVSG